MQQKKTKKLPNLVIKNVLIVFHNLCLKYTNSVPEQVIQFLLKPKLLIKYKLNVRT